METMQSLRNLREFRNRPAAFLEGLGDDLAEIYIGPRRFYVCRDAELASYFLKGNPTNYPHNQFVYKQIEPITGRNGLVQLKGEKWKKYRALTNPLFQSDRFGDYVPIIEECARDLVAKWRGGSNSPSFNDDILGLVLRISGRLFLNRDIESEAPHVVRAFLELNRLCGRRLRSVVAPPLWFPTPTTRRVRAARSTLRDFLSSASGEGALPELLKEDESLVDQVATFLFAGHETTATSILWTLALLARHPRYQTEEFILASYREALRLYPPAWILARDVLRDDVVDGKRLRAGAALLINVRAIQRHPRYWEDADAFRPERFLKEYPSHAFIPFGAGPKVCSGKGLAYLEATTTLRVLLASFTFSTSPASSLEVEEMITSHPKRDIALRMEARC